MNEQPTAVIAQQGNMLRGIGLSADSGQSEILWARQARLSETNWAKFAAECGVRAPVPKREGEGQTFVVGFDSSSVVFNRLEVPAVKDEDMAAMVKLQAEARLPLPADKMQLAWRVCCERAGKAIVTVGAGRTERLNKFVDSVRNTHPSRILLNSEGIVRAWVQCFGGNRSTAVVVSTEARNTYVCLAEEGRLSNAVSLDVGAEDFVQANEGGHKPELTERFAQDMRRVLDLFGCADDRRTPVYVLSDGNIPAGEIVSSLCTAGVNAKEALAKPGGLGLKTNLSADEIYAYRAAIGVGLVALDEQEKPLNLFERLYTPAGQEEKKAGLFSIKRAGAIAAAMLVLLVFVSYAMDIVSLRAIENSISKQSSEISFSQLKKRQELVTAVARQRQQTDVLKLLTRVNSVEANGVLLNSIDYKKDKPVTITGEAGGTDQLYKFQEGLIGLQGVSNVVIQSAPEDTKTKKLRFTIKFDYKSMGRSEPKQDTKSQPQPGTIEKEQQ